MAEDLDVERNARIDAVIVVWLRSEEEVGNEEWLQRVFGVDEADEVGEAIGFEALGDALLDKVVPVLHAFFKGAARSEAGGHDGRRPVGERVVI